MPTRRRFYQSVDASTKLSNVIEAFSDLGVHRSRSKCLQFVRRTQCGATAGLVTSSSSRHEASAADMCVSVLTICSSNVSCDLIFLFFRSYFVTNHSSEYSALCSTESRKSLSVQGCSRFYNSWILNEFLILIHIFGHATKSVLYFPKNDSWREKATRILSKGRSFTLYRPSLISFSGKIAGGKIFLFSTSRSRTSAFIHCVVSRSERTQVNVG